jgi:hypothetical protein
MGRACNTNGREENMQGFGIRYYRKEATKKT